MQSLCVCENGVYRAVNVQFRYDRLYESMWSPSRGVDKTTFKRVKEVVAWGETASRESSQPPAGKQYVFTRRPTLWVTSAEVAWGLGGAVGGCFSQTVAADRTWSPFRTGRTRVCATRGPRGVPRATRRAPGTPRQATTGDKHLNMWLVNSRREQEPFHTVLSNIQELPGEAACCLSDSFCETGSTTRVIELSWCNNTGTFGCFCLPTTPLPHFCSSHHSAESATWTPYTLKNKV